MGTTTNYGWTYPTVNADADTWGTKLNYMAIAIDASLKTVDTATGNAALKANNLSDLASTATARTNLGLGVSALCTTSTGGSSVPVSQFIGTVADSNMTMFTNTNGSIADSGIARSDVAKNSQNLSALTSASTARANLGLGSIATHNITISSSSPSGGSDGDIWLQYA